jgi:uncharacterized RDD family membrane protein YckC
MSDAFRLITTPEGVTVPFTVASAGERIGAFVIDLLLIITTVIAIWIAGVLGAFGGLGNITLSLALLAQFILGNFYFILTELWWDGRTVGKRIVGLRVITRKGGPLTAESIFARNLTRDLEFFLPMTALLAPRALFPSGPGWGILLAIGWLFVFLVLPLFNRDRLRVGDILGGTLVVRAPASVLLPDLASTPAGSPASASVFHFSEEALDIYGIHELQTLEDLLRRYEQGRLDFYVLEQVCDRIKRKIDWPADRWEVPVLEFLQEFYRAQRARLERKMLFGNRQERKTH